MNGNRLHRLPLLLLAASFCVFFWLDAAGRGQEDSQWDPRTGRYIDKKNNDVRIERRGKKRRAPRRKSSGPATISVLIVSSEPRSNVVINDVPQESTDEDGYLEVPLRAGTYTIRVSKYGYTSMLREVEVTALGAYQQDVEFTQVPAVYTMRVKTEPAEADVHLGDVYKGRSNEQGVLSIEGVPVNTPHTLRVVKDGWLPSPVELKPNEQPPPVKLFRDAVRLKVKTKPAEMEVYLDDAYKGTSSAEGVLFIERVPVNTPYTLRGVKKGFETKPPQPLAPSSEEAFIELSAVRANTDLEELRQLAASGSLAKSLAVYGEVAQQNPDNPALPIIFESIVQRLNTRSSDKQTLMGPHGLTIKAVEAKELSELFRGALRWRGGDAALGVRAEYWGVKYWEGIARESTSEGEKADALLNARAAAQRLASLNPRDPYLLFDLGVTYMRLGDNDAARKYIDDAGSLNQNWALPLFAAAQLDLAAGDKQSNKSVKIRLYQRAIQNLTRVISLKPDTPRSRELLSLAYSAAERHQEAVDSGRAAVEANPNSAYAHYVLGQAYYQLGVRRDKDEYRNAIAEFNVALTLPAEPLDPQTSSSVKEKIALMKKALGIKR